MCLDIYMTNLKNIPLVSFESGSVFGSATICMIKCMNLFQQAAHGIIRLAV